MPSNLDSRRKIQCVSANYFLENEVLCHCWTPEIYGNVCQTRKQLLVPLTERGKILVHCHEEEGHPGFMQRYSKIRENYLWVSMKRISHDTARIVRDV